MEQWQMRGSTIAPNSAFLSGNENDAKEKRKCRKFYGKRLSSSKRIRGFTNDPPFSPCRSQARTPVKVWHRTIVMDAYKKYNSSFYQQRMRSLEKMNSDGEYCWAEQGEMPSVSTLIPLGGSGKLRGRVEYDAITTPSPNIDMNGRPLSCHVNVSSPLARAYNSDSYASPIAVVGRSAMMQPGSARKPLALNYGTPIEETEESEEEAVGPSGLCNLGNTCYMNAALQCLAHTEPLAVFFLTDVYESFLSDKQKLADSFATVVDRIYQYLVNAGFGANASQPFKPIEFLEDLIEVAPQFEGSRQHDSHECLRVIIDQLSDDLVDKSDEGQKEQPSEADLDAMPFDAKAKLWWENHLAQNSSLITETFCGQLVSTIECTTCNAKKFCFDPFYDLSLPFPSSRSSPSGHDSQKVYRSRFGVRMNVDQPQISIDDCIREFTKEEMLDGQNMPECNNCRAKRKCTKRLQVLKFPPVLVLHLKRFSGIGKKISSTVDFPITGFDASILAHDFYSFEGSEYDFPEPTYDLFAVCNHTGQSNFGHYTATCMEPTTGSWYHYNDSCVTEIDDLESELNKSAAYVLFYKRRDG